MADRILKPDSGNDLVLQNDDASAKIEINENGTIPITGTLSGSVDVSGGTFTTSSAQKQAIVQAGPGSGTLDVSSGTFTSSTAQKQAIVDGATIEAQDLASGSGTTLPNNVQDAITRLGAVTSGTFNGTIGTSATGLTGIKTVDVWQLNTNVTGTNEPIQAAYVTRGSTSSGSANMGTGMTLTGSGTDPAIFTFPSTGIWRVEAGFNFNLDNSSRYIFTRIDVSTTGTTGTFTAEADSRTHIFRTDTNNTFSSTYVTAVLDVTTSGTSGTAIQFDITPDNNSTTCAGGTSYNLTYFMFTRLGDT